MTVLGTLSLVFGLLWLGGAGSILAIVFGHSALSRFRKGAVEDCRAFATAGLVLGYVGLAVAVVVAGSAIASIATYDPSTYPAYWPTAGRNDGVLVRVPPVGFEPTLKRF